LALRIAMITPETLPVPPVLGGAVQIYIDQVSRRLAKRHRITIYTVASPVPDHNQGQGIEYIPLPKTDRETYLTEVTRAVAARNYHILHVFNRPAFIPPLRNAAPHSKIILNLHNDHLVQLRHDSIIKDCLKGADHFISNSNYTKVNLLTHFPQLTGRVTTIHLGIDPAAFPPRWKNRSAVRKIQKELGLPERKVILFIGRLNTNKGPDIMLMAMKKVLRRHPQAMLLIAGSPQHGSEAETPYSKRLRQMVQGLENNVRFLGFVPPEDTPRLYLASNLLVCPSVWNEPFGRVNIEAMACGLPVVATARGGIIEAVRNGENGILLPAPPDKNHLARAVNYLLDKPGIAEEMGRAGYRMVIRYFTWQRVVREIRAIYHSLLY